MVIGIIFNPFFPFIFKNDETITFIIFISILLFGYLSYKEYDEFVLNKNRILLKYPKMSTPEQLIAKIQHPEMKHLFDEIDKRQL